jgi:hypothetical protein
MILERTRISHTLPSGADASVIAREALCNLEDVLTSDVLRDAQLLVAELLAHRMHGRPPDRVGTLDLDLSVTRQRLRVQVVDNDRGPPASSDEAPVGWELQLVADLADRWGIRRDGHTTVWFELDR